MIAYQKTLVLILFIKADYPGLNSVYNFRLDRHQFEYEMDIRNTQKTNFRNKKNNVTNAYNIMERNGT